LPKIEPCRPFTADRSASRRRSASSGAPVSARAAAKVPVASLATPDEYTFWAPGVWGEVEDRMLETLAPLGAHRSDPFLNQAAKATAQSDKLRRQLAPFAANSGNGFGSPVAYPKVDSSFPRQLSGLAAMLAANLPLRCVALTAPGEYDTHADQPQALADGLDVTWRTCWPFSATSRRAGSPTACSRSSGRSSAGAARRTAATEPTTARRARLS
jgi:hypothetical protein